MSALATEPARARPSVLGLPDTASDAEILLAWSDHARAVDYAIATLGPRLTGRDVARSLEAHDAVDLLCELYRRQHHPRAGRVVAVHGEIFTVSPTGRSIRRVHSERDR